MALQSRGIAQMRVIRPAAVVPERAAKQIMEWLEDNDVTRGGRWLHDINCVQLFSGPFDGPSGMRGTAVLFGSIHMVWERWNATIYRANISEAGAGDGLTVERLCDHVLGVVGLSLATCPRADLVDAPVPDPFRLIPRARPAS